MKLAAIPIRITDRIKPNTSTQGWSLAAPATASTLSRLMLTSASAPTAIGLSPARTMSIMMISKKAAIASGVTNAARSMATALVEAEHAPQAQHLLATNPSLVDHAHPDVENDREANIIDPRIAM